MYHSKRVKPLSGTKCGTDDLKCYSVALSSCGAAASLLCFTKLFNRTNFTSVDEILKCDHSNESYRAVLSCGVVYYAVQGVLTFESVDEILKCDHSNRSY